MISFNYSDRGRSTRFRSDPHSSSILLSDDGPAGLQGLRDGLQQLHADHTIEAESRSADFEAAMIADGLVEGTHCEGNRRWGDGAQAGCMAGRLLMSV